MKGVIDFCFKDNQGRYLKITKYGGTWVNITNKLNVLFDKKYLKLAINYVLHHSFSNLGNLAFHQTISIPMGSDPVLFMADLFFSWKNLSECCKLSRGTY